jgi:hypothetical protein
MVFDPLSIIGYVGVGLGLVNFLLSTVSRIEQFQRDSRWAKHKLKSYNAQLSAVDVQLRAWNMLWCQGEFSDEDYEYFWGPYGLATIKDLMELILVELSEIRLLMYRELGETPQSRDMEAHGVEQEDWQHWQGRLDGLRHMTSAYSPRPTFLTRLLFASFRSANLDERTKRLREHVKDLTGTSQILFVNVQFWQSVDQKVEGETLRQLNERREWMEDTRHLLTRLYDLSRGHGQWSLILSPPDKLAMASSINANADIQVDFYIRTQATANRPRMDRLAYFYRPATGHAPTPEETYNTVISNAMTVSVGEDNDHLSTWVATAEAASLENRARLARVALGVVNWTMLLWETPWTDGICCCGVKFIALASENVPNAEPQAAFLTLPLCSKTERAHLGHKALLMGVALSELALRRTVVASIHDATGQTNFLINGQPNGTVTEGQLLDMIKARNGPGYSWAVKFCFTFNTALVRGGHQFRPHDIITIEQNVTDR